MPSENPYCATLGIKVPTLETAATSPDASTYSLLIAALLERGGPMTLEEAAQRFDQAGIAPAAHALASLKRCRPGRPPIYRDGDIYHLDPRDHETELWAFRLGLTAPLVPEISIVRPEPPPLPTIDEPLTVAALDDAWRGHAPTDWSAQRLAICVLDANGGSMRAADAIAFYSARTRWARLSVDSAKYWRTGAPIRVRDDGSWELDRSHDAVRSARLAVLERIAVERRQDAYRPDPAVIQAYSKAAERRSEQNAAELARLSRVIIHAFPVPDPVAVTLVDVGRHEIRTWLGGDIEEARQRIGGYEVLAALDVRPLLRALGIDPGDRMVHELGPPQKTLQLNQRGRTLRITSSLLISGSCNISRPLADRAVLRQYVAQKDWTRLRRRLEADAKALFAMYQYGRLHGALRLRWGFLDERIPAPWAHWDEHTLHWLMNKAYELGRPLEVVLGSAPGWEDPWSRARRVRVLEDERGWPEWLQTLDEPVIIDPQDVQLARPTKDWDPEAEPTGN